MTSRRSAVVAFIFACVIACGWLNQGISAREVDARIAKLDPDHSLADGAHRVLLNLYKRASDEEIYFAIGSATRGKPYDARRLSFRGTSTPGWFDSSPPADGSWHVPYRQVPLEYPIANLPFVVLPTFGATSFDAYAFRFGLLMAAFVLAGAALTIRAQPARDVAERWWAVGALLLAEGSLSVARLDALPAFLMAWALWAAAERRRATTGIALGLATAVKLLPALLVLPLVLADREAWRTPRDRWRGAMGFVGALTISLGPMLLVPGALPSVLAYHRTRGLQVESSFGTLLGVWRMIAGTSTPATFSFGSYNLDGPAADLLAQACTPLTLLAIAAVAAVLYRAPAAGDDVSRRDRLALTLLAGTCALWLSAKVLSPQYLTWGIPLVLGVSGKRGRSLTIVLGATLLVTQAYLCGHYETVIAQSPLGVVSLGIRLTLLVLLTTMVLSALLATRPRATPVPASP